RTAVAGLLALFAAFGLGATAAQIETARLAGPSLHTSNEPVEIEGWVMSVDASERGPRLRLLVRGVEGASVHPRWVRIATPIAGVLSPGGAARCLAVIGAPSGPLAPHAYDFARRAYFDELDATGFAFGRCRPAAFPDPPGLLDRINLRIAAIRGD